MSTQILAEEPPIRIKKCRHGLFMYNANDAYIGRSLDFYGEYSEYENILFTQLLKAGMTVVEVGANIGSHTVPLAKTVGETGQVICFEPQRIVYQMLCGNIAMNGLQNVSALLAAVGKTSGTMHVPKVDYRSAYNFGGVSLVGVKEGEAVSLIKIDDLQLQRCQLIKIDVEGMELDTLMGATETLKRCRPILYVENNDKEKSESLIRFILDAGYRLYWHLTPLFYSENFYGQKDNIFLSLISINMLALPKELATAMQNFVEITSESAHLYYDSLP